MTSELLHSAGMKWQMLATCDLGGCPTVYAGTQGDVLVQGYVPADAAEDRVVIPASVIRAAARKLGNGGNHDV